MAKRTNFGLSCCSISSIPLDYEENKLKIIESIKKCKELKCSVRIGGELELCGVNCKDRFKEIEDIHENCWFYLSQLLKEKYENNVLTHNILCFVSMPVYFKKHLYNCQVVIYNNEIIFISPKQTLNDEEKKYFASYSESDNDEQKEKNKNHTTNSNYIKFTNSNVKIIGKNFETFPLPNCIQEVINQKETYIGNGFIQFGSLTIAHLFLDDLIKVERNVVIDERISHFNRYGSTYLVKKQECENGSGIGSGSENAHLGNIYPFDQEPIKLSLSKNIALNKVDILLISGYIWNELQLFKKYMIHMMEITNVYPHMVLSYNSNSGCDNYFCKFDGFSFVSQNNEILTKNARFTFDEVQVASVSVSLDGVSHNIDVSKKEEDPISSAGSAKMNHSIVKIENLYTSRTDDYIDRDAVKNEECIFSYNKDIDLCIKYSKDVILNYLPQNFNWQIYTRNNQLLFKLFKNYHPSPDEYHYKFANQMCELHNIYEELSFNSALFLWHILHLTNAKGFMLALSGGVDSGFCACMVYILSIMIEMHMKSGNVHGIHNFDSSSQCPMINPIDCSHQDNFNNIRFLKKIRKLLINEACRKKICNKLLNTLSLPSRNSSKNTMSYAEELSKAINSNHTIYCIDNIFDFFKNTGNNFLMEEMKFKSEGGSMYQDLCLQNIQSRSRLLMVYFFSTLICHKRYYPLNLHNEFLLTIATGNLDETITGYYTKYDCSSGDVNIIGNVSKILIKETICLLANDPTYNLTICNFINQFHPSAELKPLDNKQTDEDELNLKYIEIKLLTILKNNFFLGPFSMFHYISKYFWTSTMMSKADIYNKIKAFFLRNIHNTHKLFILPPSLVGECCGMHTGSFANFALMNLEALGCASNQGGKK
ncbi:glutamine-dependent NAD(+) synthetase [Plasmodium gonderi]|uniref:Glutamine-dependent NAD(+) synthetase n=1 Tax=Plasmodium gonderi TaxID=77519 RepID=A0A1Y1JDL4_PLAGO|nr:glutamine-dependent NAD(+) synthetase [Plasmodium gonderi]GAW80330.1 glutamine-dependent NAD(+) synthetase [Plasmodium gonderi]